MTDRNKVHALIASWPARKVLAEDIGDPNTARVDKWALNGSIPPKEWGAVLRSANKHGLAVTAAGLVEAHDGKADLQGLEQLTSAPAPTSKGNPLSAEVTRT